MKGFGLGRIKNGARYFFDLLNRKKNYGKSLEKFVEGLCNRPLKIVIGSAEIPIEGWVLSDRDILDLLKPGEWKKYFETKLADAFLAEHVWEHITIEEGLIAAKTCYAFLEKGGHIRVAVPDGLHPDQSYIDHVKPGGSSVAAQDHKVLYTYKTLKEVFEKAGFIVQLLEYFDEDGEFHFLEWDRKDGYINRSKRYDERNADGNLWYTSIILDAKK